MSWNIRFQNVPTLFESFPLERISCKYYFDYFHIILPEQEDETDSSSTKKISVEKTTPSGKLM